MTMKIATWNVNGIRAREAQFCEWLERDRPDVVCLQELKASRSRFPRAARSPTTTSTGTGCARYSGVSLHVSKGAARRRAGVQHPAFDMESRIVQVTLGNLVLASVYVPNGGKDYAAKLDFLTRLADVDRRAARERARVILCGDLNIARADIDVHPRERKPGVIGQRPEERELFDRLLGDHCVDVGRALDPDNERLFTWWPPWRNMRQRNIGWRIDYILASRSIADRVTDCVVLADVGTSDHAPVMMTADMT